MKKKGEIAMGNEKVNDSELQGVPLVAFSADLRECEPLIEYLQKLIGAPVKPIEFDSLKISDEERRKRLGARIRIMRKGIALKQSELAEKIGVTKAAVTAYEAGRSEPNLKNLIGLSRVLGVSIDWLLGEAPLPK